MQLFNCRTTIFDEHLPVTASALKYNHDIIIIKIVESLKLFWYEEVTGRWVEIKVCCIILFIKKASQVFQCTEKVFHAFSFQFCSTSNSKFYFYVSLYQNSDNESSYKSIYL